MRREFLVGADLGKMVDHTAVVVAEAVDVASGEREPVPGAIGQSWSSTVVPIMRERMVHQFHVTHIERYPLGMRYPDQVAAIAALLDREPLRSGITTLLLDKTGVGGPVGDLFELADLRADVVPITIHGGDSAHRDGTGWSVPKRDLVGATLTLLQEDRLKIAANLPLAPVLTREMSTFEMRISPSGHDSYSARAGEHDDLVLATAMVCWWAIEAGETQFFG